ncbi:hypothetical protein FA15DRAFT_758702 [Coprinopsis marcescibilis]|uniref:Ribonuclease P protein subunit n=1 Tax=Coprinopsis marcescibilis TaxID=230819 RepID=A0A5C3KZV8_COPMA|nr:hypothetical protein FA15DRAFT_758702 [Coprinopsis marcescibilis]
MAQQTIDIYAPLPFKSKQKNVRTTATFSSSSPFTPTYVISSLSGSSDPTALYNNRVKGRQILLENPARESRLKKETERKKQERKKEKQQRKLGLIGKRKREERGLWKFDNKSIKFASLLPLHHLWLGYMSELLGLPQPPSGAVNKGSVAKMAPSSANMHPKLLKADFHGAFLTVKKAKNPCLIGLEGIIIHETENAFKVITEKDQVKLLPKQNSIFTFATPVFSTLPATFRHGMPYPTPTLGPQSLSDPPDATFTTKEAAPSKGPGLVPSQSETVRAVPHLQFELYGNQFRFRSTERAGKKFKYKETIEL